MPAGTIVSMKVGGASGVKDGSGNNIAAGTALGSYTVAPTGGDATAPSALLLTATNIVVPNGSGPSTYTFTVAYKDNRAMPSGTLGTGDLTVFGPGGFSQAATYTGTTSTLSAIGGIRLATYTVTAPGGGWDWTDDGTCSINVAAGQVQDGAGNAVPAVQVGQIKVDIDVPGDADHDRVVGPSDFNLLASNFGTTAGACGTATSTTTAWSARAISTSWRPGSASACRPHRTSPRRPHRSRLRRTRPRRTRRRRHHR